MSKIHAHILTPSNRDWVQRCLKEALPASKEKVNAELKKVIFEAYRNKTINDTDWDTFELETYVPLPAFLFPFLSLSLSRSAYSHRGDVQPS